MARPGLPLPIAGLALAIVAAVGALGYRQLATLDEEAGWISEAHAVLHAAHALEAALERAQGARRAYALTGDESLLADCRRALARLAAAGDELRALTAGHPAREARISRLGPLLTERLTRFETAMSQRERLGFDAAREASLTSEGEALNGRIRAIVGEIQDAEVTLLAEREATYEADATRVRRTMVAGFAASAALLLAAFLLLRREMARRARSEERLAIIVDSIGDAVIATGPDGRITHVNRLAAELTGWPATEAVGRPFGEVFHIISEKTRQPAPDPVAQVLAEKVVIGLANHTALVARDGVERPIADSAAPILDAAGALHGAVIVFRDVTATRAAETRFRHLVEAAPDAIVIADGGGRITTVNDQVTALFGYPAAELVGRPVEVLLPERLRERHREHRHRYQAAPAVRAMGAGLSLVGRRKDGSELPIEVSLSPLATGDGMQVIAAVRDVTRRHELERFRDEYVGYVSHDLRNPLSVIVLQARQLARVMGERASDEESKAVRVIAENAAFIDRLVRELLEMAYVESEEVELHREPVALAPFLQAILERTISSSDRERVRLDLRGGRPAAFIEARRIERVVVNFLQNAIKYSPPGSPILVTLEASADSVELSVGDQGPGVAPDERSFVFDKYRRSAAAERKEGLGLGLYISRKIIEAHGGEIGVETGDGGRGARFFFRLQRIADLPEPPAPGPEAAVPANGGLRGLKVLMVDDNASALSALVSLLADEGVLASGATSGAEALSLADSMGPDVAVVDVQMPGMNGLELLERLRSRHPDLPAVLMTGFLGSHPGVAEARRGGVAYLPKPVDVDELLRTLGRLFPAGRAAPGS